MFSRQKLTLFFLTTVVLLIFAAISNIEGVLQRTIAGLTQDQAVRKHMDPDGAKQIDDYVAKIEALLTVAEPFHVVSLLVVLLCQKSLHDSYQPHLVFMPLQYRVNQFCWKKWLRFDSIEFCQPQCFGTRRA